MYEHTVFYNLRSEVRPRDIKIMDVADLIWSVRLVMLQVCNRQAEGLFVSIMLVSHGI